MAEERAKNEKLINKLSRDVEALRDYVMQRSEIIDYEPPTPEELEHERKYFKYQRLWAFFKPIVILWSLTGILMWLFR